MKHLLAKVTLAVSALMLLVAVGAFKLSTGASALPLASKATKGWRCNPPCPRGQVCAWDFGSGGTVCKTPIIIWKPGDPLP